MLRITLAVICVALASAAAVKEEPAKKSDDWVKPAFCNTNDCPVFEVIEENNGYELRRYPAATYVSTIYEANNPAEADAVLGDAFNKLFVYISGANENDQTIAMTAPVLTEVTPATGPNCNTKFVMSFYLPYDLQDNAPKPTASDVYLQQMDELLVYVKSFSDFASQADYLENTMALAEDIGSMDDIEYLMYYTAGYDSPFKWWNRHNESWLKAKANTKPVLPEVPQE